MKRYMIVTGGAGFIGSGIVRHLNEQGIREIVIVDELGADDRWKNLVGKQFLHIVDKNHLFTWLEGRQSEIAAFIHMGACCSTVETDASHLLQNNYQYTVTLAEYALKHGIRFIYASSAATYGDGSLGFSDDHDGLEELRPLNMYGYSKHLFDLWAKNQGVLNSVVGLKFFNVFGPNEWHKGRMASAIMHVLPVALKDGVIKLFKSEHPTQFGDGEQMRDFVYVKDVARLTCAFLDNTKGGIFNLGRGEPCSWNQLANGVFKAIDKPTNIHYIDMPQDLLGKYQNYTCADIGKLRQALGQECRTHTIEAGVADYVQNYLLPERRW